MEPQYYRSSLLTVGQVSCNDECRCCGVMKEHFNVISSAFPVDSVIEESFEVVTDRGCEEDVEVSWLLPERVTLAIHHLG